MDDAPPAAGKLAKNILYFARALRAAGLPVGPGGVLDALAAVEAAGVGDRGDFYATLHAVFVKKHEHSVLFDQAFRIFWRRKGFLEKLIATMAPQADPARRRDKPEAGANRIADALLKTPQGEAEAAPWLDVDARFTMSAAELLQTKDFEQMSAAEIARAREIISRLTLPNDAVRTRRHVAAHAPRVDPRRSFRRTLRSGAIIDLAFRAPALRHPPIVALCDISGSMSGYTRLLLHFLHALGERRRVTTFLFGTRLTNVTRALRARDVDDALARCSAQVKVWAGGTRIAASLRAFNREWSRRVLGQGAIVILFTDGLERDGGEDLGREMERLRKSCRRLIWANPLLRYGEFQAKALGIRAMLPFVDEFRAIHNLASMADLCRALSRADAAAADPKEWLRRSA
ncbi:MAG: vWA domain-containing protein [Roseiarcus sp.]